MSYPQICTDATESVQLNAASDPFRRVTINSSNKAAHAGKTVRGTHVTLDYGAADAYVRARQMGGSPQATILAVSALAIGDLVYAAASGKCGPTATSAAQLGIARTAAAAGEFCTVSLCEQSYNQ